MREQRLCYLLATRRQRGSRYPQNFNLLDSYASTAFTLVNNVTGLLHCLPSLQLLTVSQMFAWSQMTTANPHNHPIQSSESPILFIRLRPECAKDYSVYMEPWEEGDPCKGELDSGMAFVAKLILRSLVSGLTFLGSEVSASV